MNKYIQSLEKRKCCGCGACVQGCPKNALEMVEDAEGFLYPQIEIDKCINCGKCVKVCPMEKAATEKVIYQSVAYAAYTDNKEYITGSSSGGIFPELAESVINIGGVVYGAFMEESFRTYHIRVEEISDIVKLQNSKYVQSTIGDTFIACKKDLQKDKIVLFSGTGCQIYALKQFLGKDYENLITVDVICHGVPSEKIFKSYIGYLGKKHRGTVTEICFRDKSRNGWSITQRYQIEKRGRKKTFYLNRALSEYFTAFLGGMIARESCYSCPFASLDRPSDITMGDFWGYQKTRPELAHREGLSLLLVNTEQGKKWIEALKDKGVVFNEVEYHSIEMSENKNLYNPTSRPKVRDAIYSELNQYGFEYIAAKYCRSNRTWKDYIKNSWIYAKIRK